MKTTLFLFLLSLCVASCIREDPTSYTTVIERYNGNKGVLFNTPFFSRTSITIITQHGDTVTISTSFSKP